MDHNDTSESYMRDSMFDYLDSCVQSKSFERKNRNRRLSVNCCLKYSIIVSFYLYIFNVVYDAILYLKIIKPGFYTLFSENCHDQLDMAIFLDLFLTIASLVFFLYCINFLNESELEADNLSTYFFGYLLLWFGIKLSFYLLFLKNNKCLFLNIFDVFLGLLPNVNSDIIILYNMFKLFFYLWMFWLLNETAKRRRKEIYDILNRD